MALHAPVWADVIVAIEVADQHENDVPHGFCKVAWQIVEGRSRPINLKATGANALLSSNENPTLQKPCDVPFGLVTRRAL